MEVPQKPTNSNFMQFVQSSAFQQELLTDGNQLGLATLLLITNLSQVMHTHFECTGCAQDSEGIQSFFCVSQVSVVINIEYNYERNDYLP